MSARDLRAEVERLTLEMEALRRSEDAPAEWKEYLALDDKFRLLARDRQTEDQPDRDRMSRLSKSAEVKRWGDRIRALDTRRWALRNRDFDLLSKAAGEQFDARHNALPKLASGDTPRARALGLTVLDYPRVDGSTSTHPLAVLIACRCLGAPAEWVRRTASPVPGYFGGPLFLNPNDPTTLRADSEFFLAEYTLQAGSNSSPASSSERLTVVVNRLLTTNASTHQAYVNIVEGRSDIGLLARPPSPDETNLAAAKGVEISTVPIALDALVFIVNDASPVPNLTTGQIRDIYSGRIGNWEGVGGPDLPITAYQRERNSGSQELMISLVMKDLPFRAPDRKRAPKDLYVVGGMTGPFVALTRDKSGLAYSVWYYERFMSGSPRTRVIAVDGVEPTDETLRSRRYPYTTEVLLVTRKDLDPASPAGRWRNWSLSPEGLKVIAASGYVPIAAARER